MKFLIIIAILLSIFGCKSEQPSDQQQDNTPKEETIGVNYDAPFNIKFNNQEILNIVRNGDKFEFKNLKTPSIFIFFTTWCTPCDVQIQILNNIKQRYPKLKIFGILMDDKADESDVSEFIKKNKIEFGISDDNAQLFSKAIGGVENVPYMVLFDGQGKILQKYLGVIPEEMLQSDLDKIFN